MLSKCFVSRLCVVLAGDFHFLVPLMAGGQIVNSASPIGAASRGHSVLCGGWRLAIVKLMAAWVVWGFLEGHRSPWAGHRP